MVAVMSELSAVNGLCMGRVSGACLAGNDVITGIPTHGCAVD
jgi:hypothetical protein